MIANTPHRRIRPIGGALAAALIALGLGGCTQSLGLVDALSGTPDVAVTVAVAAPGNADAKTPAAIPKPKPVPEKIYPAPSRLSGMDDTQVIRLLGQPRFERRDEPALIWQYRTQTCALDLFLYRPADGAAYRVEHFEARARQNGAVSEKDCFVSLLKAQEQRRAG
jgi:hypothetical protein